jgi:O-antigen/teichoic acid export membrane protein
MAFLLGLCDLGLNAATLRAAAGHDAAAAKRAAGYARRTAALCLLPVTFTCALWLLSVASSLPLEARGSARAAVVIALGGGALNVLSQPWRSYAQGRGEIVALARARTAAALLQLAVTVAGLLAHVGLAAVASGYALGVVLEGALSYLASRDGVDPGDGGGADERAQLRIVGRSALVTNVSVAFALRVDVVILQRISSLETIAAYAVAGRVVDQGFTLVKQVSAALLPRLGARARDAERTLSRGTMLLGVLAAAPLAVVAVAGRSIVVAWAGPAIDLPILGAAATWLALAALVASTEEVAAARMSVGGNPGYVAGAICAGSLVNVAVSVAGAYCLGPVVVAVATLLGNLVTAFFIWKETMRAHGWTSDRVLALLTPPLVAGLASAPAMLALGRLGMPPLVGGVLATLVGFGGAVVAMRPELRRTAAPSAP